MNDLKPALKDAEYLARWHYKKILMDTSLLLKYIELFGFTSVEKAVEAILSKLKV